MCGDLVALGGLRAGLVILLGCRAAAALSFGCLAARDNHWRGPAGPRGFFLMLLHLPRVSVLC